MIDFAEEVEQSLSGLRTPQPQRSGTLVRLVGMTLEARGVMAPLGACCEVVGRHGHRVEAEVVGFNDKVLFLMPFTEPAGVGPGDMVRVVSNSSLVSLGPELLGRVIDGRCQPLDGKPAPVCKDLLSLLGRPINPMERGPINKILDVGVKAINGILTLGRGQRLGLIAGSGVGKSVLLGMLTRFTKADSVVIGLIGERGREVQAFIQESLGEEGLAKSVVIADAVRQFDAGRPCTARNWFGHWRATYRQRLPTFGVWSIAQFDRTWRGWQTWSRFYHRHLHRARRGR